MVAKQIVDLLILAFFDLVNLGFATQFELFAKIAQFLLVFLFDFAGLPDKVIAQFGDVRLVALPTDQPCARNNGERD